MMRIVNEIVDQGFCNIWGQHMKAQMRRSWVLTGVAAFAVVMASGGKVHAKGGIVATMGMTSQTGDPMFDYIFQIDLLPQSTLSVGGFITIYDIPSLNGPPLTSQPSVWGESVQDTGITPVGSPPLNKPPLIDDPNVPNITWIYNGKTPLVNNTDNDVDLGIFTIGRTGELASAPSPTLLFIGSLDGTNYSNMGFVVVNAVPEPSSVVLLLAGVGTVPVFWLRERRRRLSRQTG